MRCLYLLGPAMLEDLRKTYLAALIEPNNSRNANSAAFALSSASIIFCFCSKVVLANICLLTDRLLGSALLPTSLSSPSQLRESLPRGTGILFMTPVDSQVPLFMKVLTFPLKFTVSTTPLSSRRRLGDLFPCPSDSGRGLLLSCAPGVAAGVESSLLDVEFLGCLLVMPPRIFLISMTSCTPSAGLGFFSLM